MKKVNKISPDLLRRLKRKACKSVSKYKISAVAIDHKGDILGISSNSYSVFGIDLSNKYMGQHAERVLMERYKSNIKTILLIRFGKSGIPRPIGPCKECQERADELGIKIISLTGDDYDH